jgi:hypothetical protein
MFRDNPIGVAILAICAFVGVVIVWQIATGERLTYNGPAWLIWILAAILIGGSLYALFQGRIRGEDRQWPNPSSGRRSLWDRIRGRNGDT